MFSPSRAPAAARIARHGINAQRAPRSHFSSSNSGISALIAKNNNISQQHGESVSAA